jgi:hypothetical protein
MKLKLSAVLNLLFGPRIEKQRILTVHEDNLEALLDKLGVLEDLKKGELRCAFCGGKLTKENLECIFNKDGKLGLCCEKLDCYVNALELSRERSRE